MSADAIWADGRIVEIVEYDDDGRVIARTYAAPEDDRTFSVDCGGRSIRLVSWNVRQGGGRRIARQVEVIAEQQSDVVALQEVVAGTVEVYRARLEAVGLSSSVDSFRGAPDPIALRGARRYAVLVASRWPSRSVSSSSDAPIPWPERVVGSLIETDVGPLEVVSAHVPPGVSNGWIKIETFEAIYERCRRPSENPRILCGDFNSPQLERESGEVIVWGERIRLDGSVRTVVRRDAAWPTRWADAERSVITGLSGHGFVDAYRALHGYSIPVWSWEQRRRSGVIRRRFDHAFVSAELRPTSCRYLHHVLDEGLSDHAPLVLDFVRR